MQSSGQKQPRSNEMKERLKGPSPRSWRGGMGDTASPASASAVPPHGTGPIQRTASKSKAGQAPNSIARDSTNSVHIVFCFPSMLWLLSSKRPGKVTTLTST